MGHGTRSLSRADVTTALVTTLDAAPAWLPGSDQYFVRFAVNGVEVELSTVERQAGSDALECVGEGPWRHHVLVACGPHQVPAVRLEIRLATELLRERADRYGPLVGHLRTHGFDPALLRRAMDAAGVPDARRRQILEGLRAQDRENFLNRKK